MCTPYAGLIADVFMIVRRQVSGNILKPGPKLADGGTVTRECKDAACCRASLDQRAWDAVCNYLCGSYFRFGLQMAVGTVPVVVLVLARFPLPSADFSLPSEQPVFTFQHVNILAALLFHELLPADGANANAPEDRDFDQSSECRRKGGSRICQVHSDSESASSSA